MSYPTRSEYIIANLFKPFIFDAFNYFNGKVNVLNNKAQLVFLDSYDDSGILGTTNWPSVVIINPINIYISSSNHAGNRDIEVIKDDSSSFTEEFLNIHKSKLINIIIHELFHLDQIIDGGQLITVKDPLSVENRYNKKIEEDVYSMTNKYMTSNQVIIMERFNISHLYLILGNSPYNEEAVSYYQRLKPFDYYMQIFADIMDSNILFNTPDITNILYSHKNVILGINGNDIWIKSNGSFIESSIPYISSVLYEYAIAASYSYQYRIIYNWLFDSTLIEMSLSTKLIRPARFSLIEEN